MMDKKDILVLAGIIVGASIVVSLTVLLQNGIISNPFV